MSGQTIINDKNKMVLVLEENAIQENLELCWSKQDMGNFMHWSVQTAIRAGFLTIIEWFTEAKTNNHIFGENYFSKNQEIDVCMAHCSQKFVVLYGQNR